MLDILKTVLYGIVEGITEWLPISSTGHMILLDEFIKMGVSDEFFSVFLVVIQLGAIFAVIILYWKTIWPFALKSRNTDPIRTEGILSLFIRNKWILWGKILIACIPAAAIGVVFDDVFDALFYNGISVAIALIVFGILFIIVETVNKGKSAKVDTIDEISVKQALIIGCWQLVAAIFPGTSRSGTTIVGSLLCGISRKAAAEFTFLLAIPVMLGASLLKILKYGLNFTGTEMTILLVGMLTAFIVSMLIIRFFMSYIRKHDFKVFGWYRIILGIIVLSYFILK